jgi:hypothetical protein
MPSGVSLMLFALMQSCKALLASLVLDWRAMASLRLTATISFGIMPE